MDLNLMKQLCNLKTPKLKKYLINFLYAEQYQVINSKNFIMAEGDIPICLIAHLDTVFKRTPNMNNFFYDSDKDVLWSPGGSGFDDRVGVYCILQILKKGYKPHIIFTDGEEIGGIGAEELINHYQNPPFDCKALIELDRANSNDAVFYNCDNLEFEKYIEKFGFKIDIGSFTDISIIAPVWKIAAVNCSVGYYLEHSVAEYLKCNETDATINRIVKILLKHESMPYFKYIPYILDSSIHCTFCNERDINKLYYINHILICEECYNKYYNH